MKTMKTMKINEIKALLNEMDDIPTIEQYFQHEERIGAKKAIQSRINALMKLEQLKIEYHEKLTYESKYPNKIICGVDEVGRGPLAGEVVACAVILNDDHYYLGLNDSKKLSKQKRATLNEALLKQVDYGIGIATVEEIDAYNIYEATKMAMKRAINNLNQTPEVLLIDAMKLDTGLEEVSIIKGDQNSISIAAASVIAKEYRDQMMKDYSELYSGYDFEHNAGYGTKHHLEGIYKLGITPIHRKSFEPIKSMLNQ